MPYCTECGAEHAPEDEYCASCGTTVSAGAGDGGADPSTQQEQHHTSDNEATDSDRADRAGVGAWRAGRKIAAIGTVLVAVGAFLPWFKTTILGSTVSVTGITRDGSITLVLGVIAGAIVVWRYRSRARLVAIVLGALIGLLAMVYIADPFALTNPTPTQENYRQAIRIGIGLYLTAVGGLFIVGGSFYDHRRESAPSPQDSHGGRPPADGGISDPRGGNEGKDEDGIGTSGESNAKGREN